MLARLKCKRLIVVVISRREGLPEFEEDQHELNTVYLKWPESLWLKNRDLHGEFAHEIARDYSDHEVIVVIHKELPEFVTSGVNFLAELENHCGELKKLQILTSSVPHEGPLHEWLLLRKRQGNLSTLTEYGKRLGRRKKVIFFHDLFRSFAEGFRSILW